METAESRLLNDNTAGWRPLNYNTADSRPLNQNTAGWRPLNHNTLNRDGKNYPALAFSYGPNFQIRRLIITWPNRLRLFVFHTVIWGVVKWRYLQNEIVDFVQITFSAVTSPINKFHVPGYNRLKVIACDGRCAADGVCHTQSLFFKKIMVKNSSTISNRYLFDEARENTMRFVTHRSIKLATGTGGNRSELV